MDEKELIEELRRDFVTNLGFEYSNCQEQLFEFEKSGDNKHLVELLRILHSMKGSAHAAELPDSAAFLHRLETVIVAQKQKTENRTQFVSFVLNQIDTLKTNLTNQLNLDNVG
jgi:chemotaxis protein histidine kinase CheA